MNYRDIARANRREILRLMLRTGGISRVEIARQTGLAKSTVSDITDHLLTRGIIENREIRKSGRRGRPVVMLAMNPRKSRIIVADYSEEAVHAHLVDPTGRTRATETRSLPSQPSVEMYLSAQVEAVEAVARRRWSAVQGITLVGPGVVDAQAGVLLRSGFRGWQQVKFVEPFRRFGKPVFLQNGSRLRALAENWYGAAEDVDDFLYFHLDTGIGGAIVIDGLLLEGPSHGAGEFGHTVIDEDGSDGRECYCGARGCLESISSMPAIVRTLGSRRCSTFAEAWALYQKKDAAAVAVFDKAAEALARGILNAAVAIGPTTIVMGGRIVDQSAGEFVSLIREKLGARRYLADGLELRSCLLADDRAAILGAVAYALLEIDIDE